MRTAHVNGRKLPIEATHPTLMREEVAWAAVVGLLDLMIQMCFHQKHFSYAVGPQPKDLTEAWTHQSESLNVYALHATAVGYS